MYTKGEFTTDGVTYGVIVNHMKHFTEAILINSGTVVSAYKSDSTGSYSYNTMKAKELVSVLQNGIKGCTSKNCSAVPFQLGAVNQHEFVKSKIDYVIQLYRGELAGAYVKSDKISIEIEYLDVQQGVIPQNIPYIKLTEIKQVESESEDELDAVQVRTVEEIALEKEDVSWLKTKKYFIINNDEQAEQIFNFIENYNGPVAYDTETTGLRINCFGKINSPYQKDLIKYNEEHPDEKIRADKLVGIIFCVERDISYYFPCFNRKFKNLYDDLESPVRKAVVNNMRAKYTIGEFKDKQSDMADYIRNTPDDKLDLGVILMERVRRILETRHIVAHNGTFEWKVGWQYEIDTNLCDDTMIMHQIMYKFRNTTSNKGEPSNLKYLAKRELGIDQWELGDFFPDWKADKDGLVRAKKNAKKKKKAGSKIDFSYMDYDGTRVYAPTDGDVTLQLYLMYKQDMKKNKAEIEYIYNVEVLVACAVAYMEFYGHRIDETKILDARARTRANIAILESELRQSINYSYQNELTAYQTLKQTIKRIDELEKLLESSSENDKSNERNELANLKGNFEQLTINLEQAIESNTEKVLNLASPPQMCDLFYNKLQIPCPSEKQSVAKKTIKALLKEKDENGKPKYPAVDIYSRYKNEDTLMVKFFDNLVYFMYPGGFIFSSYGQIAAATGRMTCNKPNAQQYPKLITKIVIPRDGYIMLDADYSQIEYRVLTAMAKNEELAKLFSDPDSDYHTLMASLMYDVPYASVTPAMRSAAKSFNFGIPYGMGLGSLAILLTGKNTPQTRDEAKEKYEMYFKNQPRTRAFFDNVKEMAQVNGYTKTLFNRRRDYSFTDKDGNINNAKKAAALRQAGNAIIQGCLDGNTKIETDELGIIKIKDAVDKHLRVWDGDKWSEGDIVYSGKKQKCIVRFTNGQKFICSNTHRFKIVHDTITSLKDVNPNWKEDTQIDGYDGGLFVRCKDLKRGYAICINEKGSLHIKDYSNRVHSLTCYGAEDNEECDMYSYTGSVSCIIVESVEITDEYIDMYDVCNTDGGYYVADGIITHNTAADIFKIGVARNFQFIRKNKLFGLLLIINMIHDEQLMEVNVQKLNAKRILAEVGHNMQFKLDNFPPLYIGAGIGPAWGYAKGKMAEIHPVLLDNFTNEAMNVPIFKTPEEQQEYTNPKDVIAYFQNRIYEFRRQKIIEYLTNQDNWHDVMHPAIGGLINLQFNYGRGDDAKAYKGPNGETYTDQEFLELNLSDFIKENNLNVDPKWFSASELQEEKEEDSEYDDDDEDDDDILSSTGELKEFTIVDESDKMYGSSVQDMISIFGTCILAPQKICGIDTRNMYFKKRDMLIDFLMEYICEPDDAGALQIVFLNDSNVLNYTGVYVSGLKLEDIEKTVKSCSA